MGGHVSKQKVDVSTEISAKIIQNATQNCINVTMGGNTIAINGDYNILNGVNQTVSLSVNTDCSTFARAGNTFDSDLASSLSQVLHDQGIALTEWTDTSKTDQETNIRQSITANFTQSVVQNCISQLNGRNILSVTGSGNVIKNITQSASLNLISRCLLQNAQTSSVISDITNSVNQHSSHISENPLSFISDAWTAISRSALAFAAVCFIVVVSFVFIFLYFMGSGGGSNPTPIVLNTSRHWSVIHGHR